MLSGGRRNGGIRASSNVGGDWLPLHFQKTETSKTDPPRSFSERYSFSTETSVALIIAKTVSPSLRFIRFTEPVVIIEVTSPALVWMIACEHLQRSDSLDNTCAIGICFQDRKWLKFAEWRLIRFR